MHFPSAVDFHGDNLKKADKSAMDMQLFGGGNRLVWVVVYRDRNNSDMESSIRRRVVWEARHIYIGISIRKFHKKCVLNSLPPSLFENPFD